MSGLATLLRDHARRQPDAPFLTFEARDGTCGSWSYGAFDRRVDTLSLALERAGLAPGDTFLLRLRNHPATVALLLAASRTGTVAVGVDPALRARELAHCAELARACLVVEHAGEASGAGLPAWPVGAASGDWLDVPPQCAAVRAQAPPDVVELLFTSGTTSRPKGVMLTEAALLHGARVLADAAGYEQRDVPLITLSLFHAAAQAHQLWPTLLLGGRVVLAERFSASGFFAQAARHEATTSAQFAASLRMLLRRGAPDAAPRSLRHVTFAQSLAAAEYRDWEQRCGVPLQQLWGMTETVGLPIMSPLAGDRRLSAMGRAVPGYEIDVRALAPEDDAADAAPEARAPVGADEPGELVVRADPGRNVALGYFRDAEATARLLRDGWLWTGDVVRRDADGFVHFVGRHGDIIRRAGVNFSALEVEEVLRAVPGVVDAAVVGLPDAVRDERVAAVVVADAGVGEALLRERCAEQLAAYKQPEVYRLVEQLPRTSVGKVRKHVLVAELAAAAEPSPA